jgi:hypothetical protein
MDLVWRNDDRPVVILLTSHWLIMVGALVATVAGCSWLLTLPAQVRGHAANPYMGILSFVILPIAFAVGLGLMPVGIWLSRRAVSRGAKALLEKKIALRRLAGFLVVATLLNIVIMSQLSYRAVTYMEEPQFCGQTCHVMKPEFTAHRTTPHARVLCVECHVVPGATGWVESKLSGTRQLLSVMFNNYPRPIQSAMESGRLVPSSDTCEKCHWPGLLGGARLRVIPQYADDENNTPSQTVLMMMVGGESVRSIHGSHFGPGVSIRYASTDSTRQTIPWVEYRNSNTNEVRSYAIESVQPDAGKLLSYAMQCVDCHNRPTHTFELPEPAVNRAMALGRIPVSLPFIKKTALQALQVKYASSEEAGQKIPVAIRDYYRKEQSATYQSRSGDVEAAANAVLTIYNNNVFPDLGVTWGTYKNNLGHTEFPGCFRCHDEAHASADGKTITQNCSACHETIAVSEASPEVLKTLGLQEKISRLQRQ